MPSGRLAVRRTREPADSSAADQIPEHDETSGSSSDEESPDLVGCWPPCTRSTRIELSQLRARHERKRDALFECRDANARLAADASGLRDENLRLREELDELKAQLLDVVRSGLPPQVTTRSRTSAHLLTHSTRCLVTLAPLVFHRAWRLSWDYSVTIASEA